MPEQLTKKQVRAAMERALGTDDICVVEFEVMKEVRENGRTCAGAQAIISDLIDDLQLFSKELANA